MTCSAAFCGPAPIEDQHRVEAHGAQARGTASASADRGSRTACASTAATATTRRFASSRPCFAQRSASKPPNVSPSGAISRYTKPKMMPYCAGLQPWVRSKNGATHAQRTQRERVERKTAEHRTERAAMRPEVAQDGPDRRCPSRRVQRAAAAHRLVHRRQQQQPEHQVRHRQHQEHQLPPMQLAEHGQRDVPQSLRAPRSARRRAAAPSPLPDVKPKFMNAIARGSFAGGK